MEVHAHTHTARKKWTHYFQTTSKTGDFKEMKYSNELIYATQNLC